ncbi:MAG TPA: FG-GAP-like repeat-containing protein [Candidatus Eisenbacteria bacterium]|nr:FG-GAP-like repeat-containing protein [Candidatus Eisenbacteria bacterium]
MRPILLFPGLAILLFAPFLIPGSAASPLDIPPPPPDPHLIATILGPSIGFGSFIAGVGDVDGDGYEDLLAAVPGWFGGSAFLYLGSAQVDTTLDLLLAKPSNPLTYGYGSVIAAGDLNGDGYSDIVLGDPLAIPGHDAEQACYVYLGSKVPDAQADLVLHDPEPRQAPTRQFFGSALSVMDLDRDGFADLAIGKRADPQSFGRVYIHSGSASLDAGPDASFSPPLPPIVGWGFPTSMTPAGDMNGDGYSDVLVGESGFGSPPCPLGHGRATLFLGGAVTDTVPDAFLAMTPLSIPSLTQPMSSAGDFNADGFDDLVVGAPVVHDDGSISSGRAYVYFGSASPVSYPSPDLVLASESDSTFGRWVFGGKDVSGDGVPDILVATTFEIVVYFGGHSPDAVPDVTLRYDGTSIPSGTILTAADWDGDGVAEIFVGSPNQRYGRIYVFATSTSLDATAFLRGGRHPIPLARSGDLTLQVQPVGASYENEDVDPSTLTLSYAGPGSTTHIAAVQGKTMPEGDTNHDGIRELAASFRSEDFRTLFEPFRGRMDVEVAIDGRLFDHRRIHASAMLTVLGTGEIRPARISPNPLNPEGMLEFTLPSPGAVTLRLYDVSGRCVRTLIHGATYGAGAHEVPFAARNERGEALPSGVFFYSLELSSGVQRGRFVVAK